MPWVFAGSSQRRDDSRAFHRLRPRLAYLLRMATHSPPDLHAFAAPLAGRGRRGVPVPPARRRRARREEEGPVSAAGRGRGPARRDLGRRCCASTAASRERFRPSARTRLLACLGKIFGPGFLLPMLLAEEGREVKGYLDMHRRTARGAPGADESLHARARIGGARDDAQRRSPDETGEPWHRTESGGFLRNVVYGFNDGLTANFGLVAGVHRRVGDAGASHGDRRRRRGPDRRRAVDGIERLSRREERAGGLRERDRDGARRDRAHARGRARRAGADLRGEGHVDRSRRTRWRPRSWPIRSACSRSRCRRSSASASRTCRRCARRGSPALATAIGALIPVFPFLFMVGHDGDRRRRS